MDDIIVMLLKAAVLMSDARCIVTRTQAAKLTSARMDVIRALYKLALAQETPIDIVGKTVDLPL